MFPLVQLLIVQYSTALRIYAAGMTASAMFAVISLSSYSLIKHGLVANVLLGNSFETMSNFRIFATGFVCDRIAATCQEPNLCHQT